MNKTLTTLAECIVVLGFSLVWIGIHEDVAALAAVGGIIFGASMVVGFFAH